MQNAGGSKAGRWIYRFKLNNAIYKYIPLCPKNPVFLKKKQKKVKKCSFFPGRVKYPEAVVVPQHPMSHPQDATNHRQEPWG
jgi:hypothetical protein